MQQKIVNYKIDIWALGIVILEVLNGGKAPYEDEGLEEEEVNTLNRSIYKSIKTIYIYIYIYIDQTKDPSSPKAGLSPQFTLSASRLA